MLGLVAPVLHRSPAGTLEESRTLSPRQKANGKPDMTGAGGSGWTVTVTGADGGLTQPPALSTTVYVPVDVTVMDGVVSLLLQRLPDGAEEDSATLSPWQNVVWPIMVIVGAAGTGLTSTMAVSDGGLVQPASVCVTA
jgi:hypothetical protein